MTEQDKLFRAVFVLLWIGLVVIVAAIFGSITSWLAERRGHSRRKWFWLGAFLWIFAIIALLVIKPGPDAPSVGVQAFRRRQKVWKGSAPIFGSSDHKPDPKRPAPPRRSITLLPALAITIVGFTLGGILGDLLWGVVWGVIGGGAIIAALIVAKEKVDRLDMAVILAGTVVSAFLVNIVLPDTPETLNANLSLRLAGAWIPAGIAAAAVAWRKNPSPAKTLTLVAGWAGAGLLALPAAVAWEIFKPLSSVIGEPAAFGTSTYAFIGLTIGVLGGAFLLSGATNLNALATLTTVIFISLYAGAQVGFTIPGLVRNFSNMSAVGRQMWPPDFEWAIGTGQWWWIPSWDFGSALRANPLLETFRIAIIACLIGVTMAIPLALRASRITAIRGSDYWFNKGIMNVIRTIPDLFWAMIFATSVGIGPFAGTLALIFFSMAIMAKLLSETVDAVDPRPIEAARATGSHHWPAIRTSVWPQVLPNYVAYALYIFEINIRASVVLGIVGAGGIGRVLEAQRSVFRFDRVLAIVMVIFVIVFLIEQASVALRRRLV
ncbi:MAG: phosphonate ABC transporter, permease protein PhnE [Acidimicrobiia bacterium]|nr:phosphonate ABC transporter, permease protein PhnE [Acidimicrobiia bacterium]